MCIYSTINKRDYLKIAVCVYTVVLFNYFFRLILYFLTVLYSMFLSIPKRLYFGCLTNAVIEIGSSDARFSLIPTIIITSLISIVSFLIKLGLNKGNLDCLSAIANLIILLISKSNSFSRVLLLLNTYKQGDLV